MALSLQNVPAGGASYSVTTVTTTVGAGQTATITSTVGASTVNVSGTSSGGKNTLLYGVAAVAAILAITTGYLAMSGRKPAS